MTFLVQFQGFSSRDPVYVDVDRIEGVLPNPTLDRAGNISKDGHVGSYLVMHSGQGVQVYETVEKVIQFMQKHKQERVPELKHG